VNRGQEVEVSDTTKAEQKSKAGKIKTNSPLTEMENKTK